MLLDFSIANLFIYLPCTMQYGGSSGTWRVFSVFMPKSHISQFYTTDSIFFFSSSYIQASPLCEPYNYVLGIWGRDQDTPTNTKQTTTGLTRTKQFFPTCNKAVEHTPTIHRFWGHPTSFPGCPLISLLLTTISISVFNPLLTCTSFTSHLSTSHSSPQSFCTLQY